MNVFWFFLASLVFGSEHVISVIKAQGPWHGMAHAIFYYSRIFLVS